MGTMSKLNPNKRAARLRRSQAVREMRSFAGNFNGGNFRIESLAATLDDLRNDPRFTSEEKDAKFRSLLNRAR
jgi:hypothetical protein